MPWQSEAAAGVQQALGVETHNFYAVFGVPSTATASEIHTAYRRVALATHPDKGGNTEAFQKVVAAFEVLSDEIRRARYDSQLTWERATVNNKKKATKPRKHSRELDADTFNLKLSSLLQRMSVDCRRKVIVRKLTDRQRVALETHLRKVQASTKSPITVEGDGECNSEDQRKPTHPYNKHPMLQGEAPQSFGTICRTQSAGKVYGYYARVCFHGFGLVGKVRRELSTAVGDHIFLQRVMEIVRRHDPEQSSLSAFMHAALKEAGVVLGDLYAVVASVQVFISCHHYIGGTNLKLQLPRLNEGIAAWDQLQVARGETLFKGQGITLAYTQQAAAEQWQRLKSAYLRIACETGACKERLQARLRRLEDEHLPRRILRERKLMDVLPTQASQNNLDASLLKQVNRLLNFGVPADLQGQTLPLRCSVLRKRKRYRCEPAAKLDRDDCRTPLRRLRQCIA